jgi:hypothetical protein
MRAEARESIGDLQRLRGLTRGIDNLNQADLDRILATLKQMEDPRIYQDPAELYRRQAEVAELAKRFEYALRRQVADEKAVALSASDEVDEANRPLVNDYFRSLAKQK